MARILIVDDSPTQLIGIQRIVEKLGHQTLTADHFSHSEAGCLLGKVGRPRYYSAYEEHAPALRQAIQQEIKALALRIAPDQPEPSTYTPPWIPSPHDNTADDGSETPF